VQALVFRHRLPREAVAKIGGALTAQAFVSRFGPTQLEDVAEPEPPAAGWVRCETIVSGVCGSDALQVFLVGSRDNPLTALLSFDHVLGHEAVARREDTGERVVLDPWLGCVPRGIDPPCAACAAGRHPECRNLTGGVLPPALHIGNCAAVPGAHAERFCAHESQLHPVPGGVSDEAAVLADPVSVSLRSILLAPPPAGRPALVIGSGPLALAAVALLRALHPGVEVWAATRPGRRAGVALALGAHAVLPAEPNALVEEVARRVGAQRLRPWSGREWLQDGAGVVYDTVGSPRTVETAMRLLDTGGTLVVSGVHPPKRFEWTPLYFKELRVLGSNAFGVEEVGGVRKHAFAHYFDLVAAGLDLTPMITHRFALRDWRQAFLALADRKRSGAVKVLLQPG
jgi:threonine dehydrogenase-like Zn-dependent dehydrogenase